MRHPLWGRNHEGYGEDPYLSGEMAFANVRGLQGHGLNGYPEYNLAITGCKHFSAFDGPTNGGRAVLTDADWFWNYLPNFEQCVNAGSYSLMCTYAQKSRPGDAHGGATFGCANREALTTLLRQTWRSREEGVPGIRSGFVVSDCGAVHDANASLRAGCDLNCASKGRHFFRNQTPGLVASGTLPEEIVDRAVSRLLYVRHRLGEFDAASSNPFRDQKTYNVSTLAPPLQQLSLEAARQSMVLLKATQGVLPLDPARHKKLALIGIDGAFFAGYNTADLSLHVGVPGFGLTDRVTTVSDVLQAEAEFEVAAAVGCGCTHEAPHNRCFPSCDEYNSTAVAAALDGASVAVVFIGLGGDEGENHDLRDLALPGNQSRLIEDALATELPLVLVLLTCNPLNISALHDNPRVAAIVQAFYPQFYAGQAIADVTNRQICPP